MDLSVEIKKYMNEIPIDKTIYRNNYLSNMHGRKDEIWENDLMKASLVIILKKCHFLWND